MESPYRKELEAAFGAVQGAARMSQHIVSSKDKGTVEKDDLSPVTIADFAIQALLTCTLKAAFPNDRFVGEEDASDLKKDLLLLERVWELLRWLAEDEQDDEQTETKTLWKLPGSRVEMCELIDECGRTDPAGQGEGRTWVFDPIDGTKTFVRGELYAINVALLVDGVQTVGVVGCPNLEDKERTALVNEDISEEGCIVFGVRGHGSFIRPLMPAGDRMAVTDNAGGGGGDKTEKDASKAAAGPRRLRLRPVEATKQLKFSTCIRMSDSDLPGIHKTIATALGLNVNDGYPTCDLLAWVLRWTSMALDIGNANVWVYQKRDRRGKIWDHAGAMLLFEEAGGKITDVHGRDIDLSVGRKMTQNFGFVAAPKSLHDQVLKAVHQALTEAGHEKHMRPEYDEDKGRIS